MIFVRTKRRFTSLKQAFVRESSFCVSLMFRDTQKLLNVESSLLWQKTTVQQRPPVGRTINDNQQIHFTCTDVMVPASVATEQCSDSGLGISATADFGRHLYLEHKQQQKGSLRRLHDTVASFQGSDVCFHHRSEDSPLSRDGGACGDLSHRVSR